MMLIDMTIEIIQILEDNNYYYGEKKDALFIVNFETLPVVKKYFLKKENEALAVSFQTSATATF